jgi:hypothetical protein
VAVSFICKSLKSILRNFKTILLIDLGRSYREHSTILRKEWHVKIVVKPRATKISRLVKSALHRYFFISERGRRRRPRQQGTSLATLAVNETFVSEV